DHPDTSLYDTAVTVANLHVYPDPPQQILVPLEHAMEGFVARVLVSGDPVADLVGRDRAGSGQQEREQIQEPLDHFAHSGLFNRFRPENKTTLIVGSRKTEDGSRFRRISGPARPTPIRRRAHAGWMALRSIERGPRIPIAPTDEVKPRVVVSCESRVRTSVFRLPTSKAVDQAVGAFVVALERIFAEHCALRLVVELEMHPV